MRTYEKNDDALYSVRRIGTTARNPQSHVQWKRFWRRHIPKQIGFISNNIAMIVAFDHVHCGALVELRRIIPICRYHLMNIIQPIVKPWLTMGIGYVVKGF